MQRGHILKFPHDVFRNTSLKCLLSDKKFKFNKCDYRQAYPYYIFGKNVCLVRSEMHLRIYPGAFSDFQRCTPFNKRNCITRKPPKILW